MNIPVNLLVAPAAGLACVFVANPVLGIIGLTLIAIIVYFRSK